MKVGQGPIGGCSAIVGGKKNAESRATYFQELYSYANYINMKGKATSMKYRPPYVSKPARSV
jgi:hypothetical protein